jgi:hypothetical protein
MKKIIGPVLGCLSLFTLDVQAGASVPGTISLGPASAAPVTPATPVPFMDSSLLIVLGIMLLVISYRFLRQNKTAHKVLSVVLLGGGLAVGGLGVEKSVAVGPTIKMVAPDCESTVISFEGREPTVIDNDCTAELTILSIDVTLPEPNICPEYKEGPWPFEGESTLCQEGNKLAAGAQCATPYYIEDNNCID